MMAGEPAAAGAVVSVVSSSPTGTGAMDYHFLRLGFWAWESELALPLGS